jgi:DNA-binding NarL/FixJ family response regulator
MPETARRTKLLLVDDHSLFRESIARLLAREPSLDVVGDCASIDDALAIMRRTAVDLVLLDYDLGQRNGADFMRDARAAGLNPKVLVVTAGIRPGQASQLIRDGVAGIFLKRDSAASLTASIHDIEAGRVSFDHHLLREALARDEADASGGAASKALTPRERQVLSHVLEGLANKEIAARLGCSESSVKATLQQLFTKTGVRTRSQLVRVALERFSDEL